MTSGLWLIDMPKTVRCVAGCMLLLVSAASAQIGHITNVGPTQSNLEALAFRANGTLYGATVPSCPASGGSLYTVNTSTAAATLVGPLVDATNNPYAITGLAFQPGTGVLYGSTSGCSATNPGSLVIVNPATGLVTFVGTTGFAPVAGNVQFYADIAFTPNGTLYGWLEPQDQILVTIDLATGNGTQVGAQAAGNTIGSGLVSNSSGTLYFAGHCATVVNGSPSCTGQLQTLSTADSSVLSSVTFSGLAPPNNSNGNAINALAFSPSGVLFAINGSDSGSGIPGPNFNLVIINTTGLPTTPIPATWLLILTGIVCLALYQMRRRLLSLLRR
jgi:hypothetical protein